MTKSVSPKYFWELNYRRSINGKDYWTMLSMDYINTAIKNIEDTMKMTRWKIPTKVATPMV